MFLKLFLLVVNSWMLHCSYRMCKQYVSSRMSTLDAVYKEMWEILCKSNSSRLLRALNCSTAKGRNKLRIIYTGLFWNFFFPQLKDDFEAELGWDFCTDPGESTTFWMWMVLRRGATATAGSSIPGWTI